MEKFEVLKDEEGKWIYFLEYVKGSLKDNNNYNNLPEAILVFEYEPIYYKLSEVEFVTLSNSMGTGLIEGIVIKPTNKIAYLRNCYAAQIVKEI